MAKKAWAACKPCCNLKRHKTSRGESKDRLSELPDEILLSILFMASLSIKEVARTSLLSQRWKDLWKYFPLLNFEDSRDKLEMIQRKLCEEIISQERSNFLMCVNHVLEKHQSVAIERFRVAFDLDHSCQSHVDKWVAFALAKQVKRLELDFTYSHADTFSTRKPELLPRNFSSVMPALTALYLTHVRVTAEAVQCILDSCPLLENLSIYRSKILTSIRASCSALQLRYLKVSLCWELKTIDISAPKLLSFEYDGCPVELHIRNACSLFEVLIGGCRPGDSIAYAFDSLSKYLSQLQCLGLLICLSDELKVEISHLPPLKNLQHLQLTVCKTSCIETLCRWTHLIEASPVLQKLTLKLVAFRWSSTIALGNINGRSLKCLKTLEVVGFTGCPLDLEILTFVVKNAIILEEVIANLRKPEKFRSLEKYCGMAHTDSLVLSMELKQKLPQGVRLIIKQ